MKRILIGIIVSCFSSWVSGASFDCKKASTAVETMICSERKLSDLDDTLKNSYQKVLTAFPACDKAIKSDQYAWLKEVRNKCDHSTCLHDVYGQRIAELNGYAAAFMPTVSATKGSDNLTGTYRTECYPIAQARGGELRIQKLLGKEVRFELFCIRGAPSYNMGEMNGIMTLNNKGIATFVVPQDENHEGPCEMIFDFTIPSYIGLKQNGESAACGFGYNVRCDDLYERKSATTPKFDMGAH